MKEIQKRNKKEIKKSFRSKNLKITFFGVKISLFVSISVQIGKNPKKVKKKNKKIKNLF